MAKDKASARQANTLGLTARAQVLQATEAILTRDGYHELSTRKIASACGISVGNLTYHFPNKMVLMEAVMQAICDRYDQQRGEIWTPTKKQSPRDYLEKLIAWMLDDAVKEETSGLFLELWILAKHHDFGREILERFYGTVVTWIQSRLAFYFPQASAEHQQQAAYFILTLSEGTLAVFSRPHDRAVNQQHIANHAVLAVMAILGAKR